MPSLLSQFSTFAMPVCAALPSSLVNIFMICYLATLFLLGCATLLRGKFFIHFPRTTLIMILTACFGNAFLYGLIYFKIVDEVSARYIEYGLLSPMIVLGIARVTHTPSMRTIISVIFWLEMMTFFCLLAGYVNNQQIKSLWFTISWLVTLPVLYEGIFVWPVGAKSLLARQSSRLTTHFIVISVNYSIVWLLSHEGFSLIPRCLELPLYAVCDIYTKTGFVLLSILDPSRPIASEKDH